MREVLLTFTPVTSSADGNGDYSETAGTAATIRGGLKQLSGNKLMTFTELLGKEVYEFTCFENSALVIGSTTAWGSKVLIIYSIVKNYDESFTNKNTIILYAK